MSNVNLVILIGRSGKEPEIRYSTAGEPIANLSLATSERWNDKSGVKQERTEWHNLVVFGKPAQFVRDFVHKGDLLYVEGSLFTETWTDKDQKERKSTKIKARKVTSLAKSGGRPEDPRPREDHEPAEIDPDETPF
jgi:single-strand DNA-binding protein